MHETGWVAGYTWPVSYYYGNTLLGVNMQKNIKKYWPVFTLPVMAAFAIGFVIPFAMGIYLSFTKFTTVKDAQWVGLSNYAKLLADQTYLHSFFLTVAFAAVTIILINVIAFAIAMALTKELKGTNIFRTVFFMPNLIGGIVLGYIWKLIFDGILSAYNTYLTANATFGFWGLVILMAWQQIGYMMIVYISGFQSVSEDIIEAAKIDGATSTQTLFKVIIPNMMSSITICTFLTLTNSFKLYDQNLSLTAGMPIVTENGVQTKMTEMLALNITSSFNSQGVYAKGTAQAKAVLFFIMVAIISIIQLNATRSKEVQN